jgi:hypothetical protein
MYRLANSRLALRYRDIHSSVRSSAQHLSADTITIWAELKHLVRVYTRQAAFYDWITAEAMNQKVMVLDTCAEELADVIMEGELDIMALAKASSDLNAMLMPNEEAQRLARLREQYSVKAFELIRDAQSEKPNRTPDLCRAGIVVIVGSQYVRQRNFP